MPRTSTGNGLNGSSASTVLGIKAQGRITMLKLNYRNTAQVLLAYEFAKEVMQPTNGTDDDMPPLVEPSSAGRRRAANGVTITRERLVTELQQLTGVADDETWVDSGSSGSGSVSGMDPATVDEPWQ